MTENMETTEIVENEAEAVAAVADATTVLVGSCALCGKTLTDPESVQRGIGPECMAKAKAIMDYVGLADEGTDTDPQGNSASAELVKKARAMYYDLMSFKEQPGEDEWMPLKEAFDWFNDNGVPAARLNKLCGGDRPLPDEKRPEAFEVKYFKGRRYIRRATISEELLENLRNAGSAARIAAAAAKREQTAEEKAKAKIEREAKLASAKIEREKKAAEKVAKAQAKAAEKAAAKAAKAATAGATDGSEPAAPKAKKAGKKVASKKVDAAAAAAQTSVEF